MTKEKVQLIVGGLLHDIGKVIYRQGDGRKHSISGYEFLKEEVGLKEKEVLDSVRYHHGAELGAPGLTTILLLISPIWQIILRLRLIAGRMRVGKKGLSGKLLWNLFSIF